MTKTYCYLALAVCTFALLATSCFRVSQTRVFESIDVAGATWVTASDIDDRGRILGDATVPGWVRGFVMTGRDTAYFEVAGSNWTSTSGFNVRSQIVGTYRDDTGEPHGYLLDGGVLTEILVPGSTGSSAADINDRGVMAGGYVVSGVVHGFILERGRFTTFDVPGALETYVSGINDLGFVVGTWRDDHNAYHGYILHNGAFTHLDVPGASITSAKGINSMGHVVGGYKDATGVHGFLRELGVFKTIDFPGARSTTPVAINDRGDIVGEYVDADGRGHGFVARARVWKKSAALPMRPELALEDR